MGASSSASSKDASGNETLTGAARPGPTKPSLKPCAEAKVSGGESGRRRARSAKVGGCGQTAAERALRKKKRRLRRPRARNPTAAEERG